MKTSNLTTETHKDIVDVVEKIVDDKFRDMNKKVNEISASLDKLTKAILGSDDDKRWGRKSFVERFTELEAKVEFTFKRINETKFSEYEESCNYTQKLRDMKAIENLKWVERLKWISASLIILITPKLVEYTGQILDVILNK
jgi:hypothetical protein